jgi:hypothetical protein
MNRFSLLKRSIFASFFLCFAQFNLANTINQNISEHDIAVFNALLHQKGTVNNVQHPKFSALNQQEEIRKILATLNNTGSTRDNYICNFPARSFWLSKRFKLQQPLSFEHCPNLQQYLNSVRAESISLVYASENLTSSSSFMGHSYLKVNGKQNAEHAVSYFTEVDSINIPKLMFDSIIIGKEGYFIVSPYAESEQYYSDIESRNIYEYHLALTEFEVKLITLHLWELKDKQIDYFFHTHNCATITLDILGITKPQIIQSDRSWLSPLDVIKIVNENDLVKQTTVKPSINWQLRAYGTELSQSEKKRFLAAFSADDWSAISDIKNEATLNYFYASALNDYYLSVDKITDNEWAIKQNLIDVALSPKETVSVDVSQFKNPLRRSSDNQLGVQLAIDSDENYLLFSMLPASHLLSDDNRHAFSESSLKLLSPEIILSKEKLKLKQLDLYAISQYIPYDSVVGGISGYFSLGYSGFDTFNFSSENRFFANAGLGLSYQTHSSLQWYSTLGVESSIGQGNIWLTPSIDLGLFAYLKGNNKLRFNNKVTFNEFNNDRFVMDINLDNTYFMSKEKAITFGLNYKKMAESDAKLSIQLGLKIYL